MSDPHLYSRDEQIQDASARRPHLVILGAGASVAACPNGDKNGTMLPVMNNLAEVLGLEPELDREGVSYKGMNFEDVYAGIVKTTGLNNLRAIIEERVAEYFRALELPEEPSIYDYLVLSLRPKDAIATFNWDPFLWQSCQRNHARAPLPKIFFLHGCSVVGWCENDKRQGILGSRCEICGKEYAPTKMLYPVSQKNYNADGYIESQWRSIKEGLRQSFILTIFGYSAPDSDVVAVDMMSSAWGNSNDRYMEEIEIIDVKNEDALRETWSRFIHTHHYTVAEDYFDSILGQYPRRSVEAYTQSLYNARFREENPVLRTSDLAELWEWHRHLIDHEA